MKNIKKIELLLEIAERINEAKKCLIRWTEEAKKGSDFKRIYNSFKKQGVKRLELLNYAYELTLTEINKNK